MLFIKLTDFGTKEQVLVRSSYIATITQTFSAGTAISIKGQQWLVYAQETTDEVLALLDKAEEAFSRAEAAAQHGLAGGGIIVIGKDN